MRGGRSSHDSKLLGRTDGRLVASFAELSWEPGRFGGGRLEGSGLHILKVRRLVVDHWRMDCGGRKNVGKSCGQSSLLTLGRVTLSTDFTAPRLFFALYLG